MEEKLRFVYEYERDEETMRELCSRYGISRETGYVWLRRYRQHGARGLVELDRAPRHHPNQTPIEIEQAVLGLREAHMRWGPRKLKRILDHVRPADPRLVYRHKADPSLRYPIALTARQGPKCAPPG
jgi:transposase-like protein